jgi:hypothetical protein
MRLEQENQRLPYLIKLNREEPDLKSCQSIQKLDSKRSNLSPPYWLIKIWGHTKQEIKNTKTQKGKDYIYL